MKRIISYAWLPVSRRWMRRGPVNPQPTVCAYVGLLWNWRAGWVGYHHSAHDRRTCVNLVPFLTIWYTRPGGMLP